MSRISGWRSWLSCIVGALALGLFYTPALFAQNTAFSYQGQLKNGAVAANGNYNLAFRLYPVPDGGGSLAPAVILPDTAVSNGLFSVLLDFGAEPWAPDLPRWLEIEVNGQTLSPRVALTPVPSSLSTRGINVDAAGNVGIGEPAPAQKLSVAGVVQSTSGGFMFPDGTVQSSASTGGGGFWSSGGTNIFNNNAGNVGIGTSSPGFKLDINSSAGLGARIGMQAAGGGALVIACNPGDNRVWLEGYNSTNNGSPTEMLITGYAGGTLPKLTISATTVGIGTSTPTAKLHVRNTGIFSGGYGILGETSAQVGVTGTANDAAGIGGRFANTVGGLALKAEGAVEIQAIGQGADLLRFTTERPWIFRQIYTGPSTGLQLYSTSGAKNLEITCSTGVNCATFFTQDADPRVGIGTTTPGTTLDVNGTTRTKVLEITGADLAEKFPTRGEKPEPGTVMEIDSDHPGELRMSREAYSSRVAGVVSGAGDLSVGAVLGNLPGSENSPAIALSGRVWVRCDATEAAITPGDLLTTSDKPGHAMKASDRERAYGAVLGKAMTALKKGETSLVLVLVNLQ